MIVTLDLKPGQPLIEKELCETFGVSRTPLREAVLRLAEHGLIAVAPQHGTFVAQISPHAVRLAHFLRESLEVPMITRLTQLQDRNLDEVKDILLDQQIMSARDDHAGFIQLDDRFHEALFAACGLAELWGVIHAKKGHLDRIRFLQGTLRGNVATPLAQHEAIVAAIDDGDTKRAELLMREHIAGSLQFMEIHLRERPEMFDVRA